MLSLYYFSWLRRRTPSYVMKADIKYCRYYCRSQDLIVLILVTGSLLLIKVSESGVFMSTIYFMSFITAVYERIRPYFHYATVKRYVFLSRILRVTCEYPLYLFTPFCIRRDALTTRLVSALPVARYSSRIRVAYKMAAEQLLILFFQENYSCLYSNKLLD